MLEIKTTGFDDYLDGSANIKAMVIGGPGAGKTRYASFWPKPFYIDCEDGRGSIADRAVPYVRARSSKDVLDTLQFLKGLESTPKGQRRYQTIVFDTADSFQRIVKEEWVTMTNSQSFTGFDAWGYLDTKMNLLFTRLLNLDYNVVVLVHYSTKEHKEGDNTIREFVLQMQGKVAETIFNDFGLVGWMGTYFGVDKESGTKVQKRGLTFQPTESKPFLKDRFNVTPPWMEVVFAESDFDDLFAAFTARVEGDENAIPEVTTVGAVPDSEAELAAPKAPIVEPAEGGPLPERPPAEVPLDRQSKAVLEKIAKDMGLQVRGNTLKSEIVQMIETARASGTSQSPSPSPSSSAPASTGATTPTAPSPTSSESSTPTAASSASPSEAPASEPQKDDPWSPPMEERTSPSPTSSQPTEQPQTPAAEQSEAAPTPAETASTPTDAPEDAEALVAAQLGGEVIAEEKADAPTEPAAAPTPPPTASAASAPKGPSACADCRADLAPFWADPATKGVIRMSFIKNRRYLCPSCNANN